jgi:hypothetical protein
VENQAWWCTYTLPALEEWRPKAHKFKAKLNYIVYLKLAWVSQRDLVSRQDKANTKEPRVR